MDKLNVKVYYLFHSSFAVETSRHLLIFDYFRDSAARGERRLSNGVVGADDISNGKSVFVFSSHNHMDHFNPVVFEWKQINSGIRYILSSDIEAGSNMEGVSHIAPGKGLQFEDLSVKAFGSTDIGVSYLVRVDGISLFHAGDLNWWHWWDDTPEETEAMENSFKDEVSAIKGEKIDLAFFPLDPRLRHYHSLGAEYFIMEIAPAYFFPMHFGYKYNTTRAFSDRMRPGPSKVLEITRRGQEFIL